MGGRTTATRVNPKGTATALGKGSTAVQGDVRGDIVMGPNGPVIGGNQSSK